MYVFNPELITSDGIALSPFDKIHYNGLLFQHEREALDTVTSACTAAQVKLYTSMAEFDMFLNASMSNAKAEAAALSSVIKTLEPGDYYFNGRTIRPLTLNRSH